MLLWILVATTLVLFWRVRPLAGLLLAPYLVWMTFAAALCRVIWRLNPELLG
jgi:tryptophan-rich sensory protein